MAATIASMASPSTWRWRLPYVLLALFIAAILSLVWLVREKDLEDQRATLINDVLWIEQNLRFQLEKNADLLAELGPELLGEHGLSYTAAARAMRLIQPDNPVVQVIWMLPDGSVGGAMPRLAPEQMAGDGAGELPAESMFRLASASGRAVFGPVYQAIDNDVRFALYVPYYRGSEFAGVVVGIHSLRDLVTREVPWWFSERYRLSILDTSGHEIVSKSKVAAVSTSLEYMIPLDPPGRGVSLKVTPYRAEVRWVAVLLGGAIALLAAGVVWSVWQLRRHVVRRQEAERALREEYAFRRAMEDSLLTGLRARDMEGRMIYVNPAFCRMVGYSADELIGGKPPMPYWDPDDLVRTQALHEYILARGTTGDGVEVRLKRRNGERLDALIFEAPLIDAQGRQTGWMGSVLDITEQKRAQNLARQQEERLQATSRLITMGEMASTLAHELNQPLAAIASYATGCLNRLEQGQADREELTTIIGKLGKQAQRAGQIIRRVHDFVRRSEPKRENLDLNAIVREAVGLVEPDARKRAVDIELALTEPLPATLADPVMVEQVAINLIRNGMDAMKDVPPKQRRLVIATHDAGHEVALQVTDRGAGVPPEVARKLFEPFFTTKSEGMGMGLNICRSIAELHRGRLVFEDNPEGGTIFTFWLPVAPP